MFCFRLDGDHLFKKFDPATQKSVSGKEKQCDQLKDQILIGFVAYTQYIGVSYPEHRKSNGFLQSLFDEIVMQNFEGANLSHSSHMQFVKTSQVIKRNFPLRSIEFFFFNRLYITAHIAIP